MKTIIALAALLFAGCATKPTIYTAPNAAPVRASVARVARAVDSATTSAKASHEAVTKAIASANTETDLIAQAKASGVDVSLLESTHLETLSDLAHAQESNLNLASELFEANNAEKQFKIDAAKYESEAEALADKATEENAARIKAEKSLSWYRWHWAIGWIIFVSGIIACAAFAFLKTTGRITLSAAEIAAKL